MVQHPILRKHMKKFSNLSLLFPTLLEVTTNLHLTPNSTDSSNRFLPINSTQLQVTWNPTWKEVTTVDLMQTNTGDYTMYFFVLNITITVIITWTSLPMFWILCFTFPLLVQRISFLLVEMLEMATMHFQRLSLLCKKVCCYQLSFWSITNDEVYQIRKIWVG